MDLSKEEIIGNIQRLNAQRIQAAAMLKDASRELGIVLREQPAHQQLEDARKEVARLKQLLSDQAIKDERYEQANGIFQDRRDTFNTIESSLSEMLLLYTAKTGKKSVHADPDEPNSVDRMINFSASVGKKVPANLSLFDGVEGEQDEQTD